MNRSISVMIGKGSINHNNRTFIANNVDEDRTQNNIVYCNENIKDVYHELFDNALQKYNAKQTRKDRMIPDYYEKIRMGKQEKLFHEVIFQIGNKDDMNARDDNGQLAKVILDEFMDSFKERNPQLRIFSAHLHMDEETPHLHIDFIPFTTRSMRGLETRVSLKQALAQQGFSGNSKSETEWNKWVESEKEELAKVMERHDVQWEKLGTREPHLSVLDFKKQERIKEIVALNNEVHKIESKLSELKESEEYVSLNIEKYYQDKEWDVPSPQSLMSAKQYREKMVISFVMKLKNGIKSVVAEHLQLRDRHRSLSDDFQHLKREVNTIDSLLEKTIQDNRKLSKKAKMFDGIKLVIGGDKVEEVLKQAQLLKRKQKKFDKER